MIDIKAKTAEERRLQVTALTQGTVKPAADSANRPEKAKADGIDVKDGVDKAPAKSKPGVAASMLPDEEREEAKSLEEVQKTARDAAATRPELMNK